MCVRERGGGVVTHGLVRSCDQLRAKETEENCSEFPLSSPSITTHRHTHTHSHTRTLTLWRGEHGRRSHSLSPSPNLLKSSSVFAPPDIPACQSCHLTIIPSHLFLHLSTTHTLALISIYVHSQKHSHSNAPHTHAHMNLHTQP